MLRKVRIGAARCRAIIFFNRSPPPSHSDGIWSVALSHIWLMFWTETSRPAFRAPKLSCIMHDGHSVARIEAPVSSTNPILRPMMAAEVAG